jgi:hypothetical protein
MSPLGGPRPLSGAASSTLQVADMSHHMSPFFKVDPRHARIISFFHFTSHVTTFILTKMAARKPRKKVRFEPVTRLRNPKTPPNQVDFELEEDEQRLMRLVDVKKRKLHEKIEQLDKELSTHKKDRKAQAKEAARLKSLKETNMIKQSEYDREMRNVHEKISRDLDLIEDLQEELAKLRKEDEYHSEQQRRFMYHAPHVYLARIGGPPIDEAISGNNKQMLEIRVSAPPYTGDYYKKLPEYRQLKKSNFYLNIDKVENERYLKEGEKEKAESRAALEKWTKEK